MTAIETPAGERVLADQEERLHLFVEEHAGRVQAVVEEPPPVYGMGWIPDIPDLRDYTAEHELVAPLLEQTAAGRAPSAAMLPVTVDLRPWFPPIEQQGQLGSCTANAVVGLVEYFEQRAFGKWSDASRLFLYKATRNLLRWQGDTGAYLRSTMGALALFGVPPERYWPYTTASFDVEPPAFCYAFAADYKAIVYYRLDTPGTTAQILLDRIKTSASGGIPCCFGFTVYDSIAQAGATGKIPFPAPNEKVLGGHAIDVVGYDDSLKIPNPNTGGGPTTGAFLIRNSWGSGWGNAGYGWLPYEYVLQGLARDFWALIKANWIDTGQFV
jgi:C1A family cysteine protease